MSEQETNQQENLMQKLGVSEEDMERYREMIAFVETCLDRPRVRQSHRPYKYDRFTHTKRVLSWTLRLYEAWENKARVNLDSLIVATIFHDSAYCVCEDLSEHAQVGAKLTGEYLYSIGYPQEQITGICDLVGNHSRKDLMHDGDISDSLVILMEADYLDDMGAQGIVMDVWYEAMDNPDCSFESIRDHFIKYTLCQQHENRAMLRSEAALRFWDEKTALVEKFVAEYTRDLEWPM